MAQVKVQEAAPVNRQAQAVIMLNDIAEKFFFLSGVLLVNASLPKENILEIIRLYL